ncbi:MAG TPA: tRNA (adenosine(37)-N6)-threonylcarbamoyltransferase complex dimerization subunit type 1 TsaB [Tepidisphaeraceae bacterium]
MPNEDKAIALETSGRAGSVALYDAGHVVVEEEFPHGLKHAAALISILDRLTRSAGWSPHEIKEVYVSAGPGSFTGLRVGITVAKTLALSIGAKLVAVPTTDVLARNAPEDWLNSIIVLDAKRGQIFTARFANEAGRFVRVEAPHLGTLAEMLARSPRPVHLIGEGIPYHRAAIPHDPGVIVTSEESWRAKASVVAQVGWPLARNGNFTDPDRLTPIYIRRPEAEEKWEEQKRP